MNSLEKCSSCQVETFLCVPAFFLRYIYFLHTNLNLFITCALSTVFFPSYFLPSQALHLNLNIIRTKLENELKRYRLKDGFLNWRGLEYKCAGENAALISWLRDLGGRDKGREYILLSRQQAQVLCVCVCGFYLDSPESWHSVSLQYKPYSRERVKRAVGKTTQTLTSIQSIISTRE